MTPKRQQVSYELGKLSRIQIAPGPKGKEPLAATEVAPGRPGTTQKVPAWDRVETEDGMALRGTVLGFQHGQWFFVPEKGQLKPGTEKRKWPNEEVREILFECIPKWRPKLAVAADGGQENAGEPEGRAGEDRLRLGETVEECRVRYGEPENLKPKKIGQLPSNSYLRNGYRLQIVFVQDERGTYRAAAIIYSRPEKGTGGDLKEAEIQTFLKLNAGRHRWQERTDTFAMARAWSCKELDLRADYDVQLGHGYALCVVSQKYDDACKEAERKQLEGL